jgi:phage/plasmid-like protein (TIGR03299 family)
MAHKLDMSKGQTAFVSFQETAWHGLGEVVEGALSAKDALIKGGLDYEVIKLPNVHMLPNGEEIISDDSFFTLRTDVMRVLGSKLGKDYAVMQNIDALDVVDEILQSGQATIATAGAINDGKRVFICLKMNKDLAVKTNDIVEQYVLIANSHDGSLAVTALPTNVRVVCNNTLSASLSAGKGKSIKIRHSGNAQDKLHEASKILGLINTQSIITLEGYQKMAENVIDKQMFMDYVGNLMLTAPEISELRAGTKASEVISTRKQNLIDEVLRFNNQGIGQSVAMKGNDMTMWSAYNAITGYATSKKYGSADDRMNSLMFGSSAKLIEDAGILALEPEKIISLKKSPMSFNMN